MIHARFPVAVSGGVLALSLVLTGCGGATTTPAEPGPAGSTAAQAAAPFNDADVQFAQMMIPHHRQAVDMAELAVDRAQSPDVKALAEQIRAAQEPEIAQLTALLNTWGVEVPAAGSAAGMDHGSMSGVPDMPGMMTPEQMDQLQSATGAAFDEMFLTMMIEHHRSAVSAAQREIEQGSNPEAKQLAERIVADQNAEISRMQQLLQAG